MILVVFLRLFRIQLVVEFVSGLGVLSELARPVYLLRWVPKYSLWLIHLVHKVLKSNFSIVVVSKSEVFVRRLNRHVMDLRYPITSSLHVILIGDFVQHKVGISSIWQIFLKTLNFFKSGLRKARFLSNPFVFNRFIPFFLLTHNLFIQFGCFPEFIFDFKVPHL